MQHPFYYSTQLGCVLALDSKLTHFLMQGLAQGVHVCMYVRRGEVDIVRSFRALIVRRDSLSISKQLQYLAQYSSSSGYVSLLDSRFL